MWPISYINPNTYHNNVQYPVENVPFAQNVKPESISSVYQSNPMYINEGYPYECSAHPQHFSNGKNSQGLICTTCSNTNNDPYYRSDLKMYICRFCGGGFSENNLQNQATSKPLKYMTNRPLLMKKDIIKKRNRTCSQMVRLRESKVETRNRTQVQKLAGEFQSENISYQGHGCSNNQTQTNSAF
ncbi:hypothetical protein RF11_16259 [Thelohanellus kitauei]|uniref:GATA-type domain-containing protein n=1 Tax=Thelohanellus kitauei TaxID=669202 RepID=A0A0C2N6Q8_THEKT|nr:hypothetical protein RF11_16259 [Thelohanellus kitauei]